MLASDSAVTPAEMSAAVEQQGLDAMRKSIAWFLSEIESRDKTIEVLRQQLVQARKGAPPSSAEQPGVA